MDVRLESKGKTPLCQNYLKIYARIFSQGWCFEYCIQNTLDKVGMSC